MTQEPQAPERAVTKVLADAHDFILQCQNFFELEDEGAVRVELVDVDETPEDLERINVALEKLRNAIMDFDCEFHDLFDCR